MKNSVIAFGKYYFKDQNCPIAVWKISSDHAPQHEYDFTSTGHYHDFSEIVLVCDGSGVQYIDNREYPVSAGDVFVLNGYTVHSFAHRENLVLYNLQFDPARLPLPEGYLRKLPGYNMLFLLDPKMRKGYRKMLHINRHLDDLVQKMQTLKEVLSRQAEGFEAVAFSILLSILILLSQASPVAEEEQNSPLFRMGNMISLMEKTFLRQWSLEELAREACMSVNNFLRLFKSATGFSPCAYLIRLRLKHAVSLLENSDLPLGEIAEKSGFCDSNYFSKVFKREYHLSPRLYRKNKKQQER